MGWFLHSEDRPNLAKLIETVKNNFNDRYDDVRRHWGGNTLSSKSQARKNKIEKAKAREVAHKNT
jgi:large subunit ribosomal protein L7Ae